MKGLRLPASFPLALLPSRHGTTLPASLDLRSRGCQRAPTTGLGLAQPAGPTRLFRGVETTGSPNFLGNPLCICPALRPRQDRRHQAGTVRRCGPRCSNDEGSHNVFFRGSITQLLHSLSTLRAAIADDDARLASGGWLALTGWGWLPTGFQRKVSSFDRLSSSPSSLSRLDFRV